MRPSVRRTVRKTIVKLVFDAINFNSAVVDDLRVGRPPYNGPRSSAVVGQRPATESVSQAAVSPSFLYTSRIRARLHHRTAIYLSRRGEHATATGVNYCHMGSVFVHSRSSSCDLFQCGAVTGGPGPKTLEVKHIPFPLSFPYPSPSISHPFFPYPYQEAVWLNGNALVSINVVTLCWDG